MPQAGLLGRLPKKFSPKTLKLSNYLLPDLPTPPAKLGREWKIPVGGWQMFGNDSVGDCTCAAMAHMLMLVTEYSGDIVLPTLQDVLKAYSDITGYSLQTGINDNGAALVDVLNYWQTTGIAGHKILGWAEIDHTNIERVKQGIWLFGGVDLGVNLPSSAMEQFTNGKDWQVVAPDGGSLGGHCIPNFGYGRDGTNCITWGARQAMSWDWFTKYCDEAYVVITEDWCNKVSGVAPNAFNLDQLTQDLKHIAA